MEGLAQVLIVLAIALGWWLGRYGPGSRRKGSSKGLALQLPAGVQLAFENYSDDAIDKYVQALEVSPQTFTLHLSIASHFRKKGEVERAILIHQNLLASPLLESDEREQATFELARDYMSAGLLDRAEALLKQLEKSRLWGARSLLLLLEILQDEKEWAAARQVAGQLDPRRERSVQKRLAHYCCEQAELALRQGEWQEARGFLREAAGHDRSCVRVSLMYAQLHQRLGGHQAAIAALHRVADQDVRFLSETVAPLVESYRALNQMDKLRRDLEVILQRADSGQVQVAYAEVLKSIEGDSAATAFLSDRLHRHPSVKSLHHYVGLLMVSARPHQQQGLEAVRQVTQKLINEKPLYLCENCGFSGRLLLWLCPSCKQWETIKPVQGVEGS